MPSTAQRRLVVDPAPLDPDDGRSAGARPWRAAINLHSFAGEEFEANTAQNYHGVEDPA